MAALKQIAEENATPEIAAIYSEIKRASALPMVNLIWRHFAVFPGVLRWIWDAVSPLVQSLEVSAARRTILASIKLPPMAVLGLDGWNSAGVTDRALIRIGDVTDAYVRGNLTNILALTALRIRLEYPTWPAAILTANPNPAPAPAQLDPLPRIEALNAPLVAQLRALAMLHQGAEGYVIPSFYLALSYWPGVIESLPTWLSSLYVPAAMSAATAGICKIVDKEVAVMLPRMATPPEGISAIQPALQNFTRVLIPGAIPVCVGLQRLIPGRWPAPIPDSGLGANACR